MIAQAPEESTVGTLSRAFSDKQLLLLLKANKLDTKKKGVRHVSASGQPWRPDVSKSEKIELLLPLVRGGAMLLPAHVSKELVDMRVKGQTQRSKPSKPPRASSSKGGGKACQPSVARPEPS